MRIVNEKISRADLAKISEHYFGDMTKGVVDVEKELVAIDAELHADLAALLLENGSRQEQLWSINLYPDENGEDFIEFDSLINIALGRITAAAESMTPPSAKGFARS